MNNGDGNNLKTIHANGTNYIEIPFCKEQELERLAVEHKDALYGKSALYFDIKTVITSIAKNSRIPNGYLITGTNSHNAKFWVIEYELADHSLDNHILGQLMGFVRAVKNEVSKKKIRDILFEEISANPDYRKRIKEMMIPVHNEIGFFLEKILEQNCGLIVVIDEKSERLKEEVDDIQGHKDIESHILEFARFENEMGQQAFLLDTLYKESQIPKGDAVDHSQLEELLVPDNDVKQLHEQAENAILALGNDVVKKQTNSYVGFWRNNTLFAVIYKRRTFLTIGVNLKPFELHDQNKVAKGRGRGSVIDLSSSDEINYVLKLVKQAYDKV